MLKNIMFLKTKVSRAHAKHFISENKLYSWPNMTPEDPQKDLYFVMRHFISDAQKIPGGDKFYLPPPGLSSAIH